MDQAELKRYLYLIKEFRNIATEICNHGKATLKWPENIF